MQLCTLINAKEKLMTILNSPTKLLLAGRGEVTVRPSNYLATGGEGSVYRLNDTIVKLYTDIDKMFREGVTDKIHALSVIRHPQIVSPIGRVEHAGKDVGYYMAFVDGEPLSRMFTNDFILRHGITFADTLSVVQSMREIVSVAHQGGAILVDANELNWLVALRKGKAPLPYVIDVDSWAIDKWKANVIMPSIQDVHATTFDEKSDWFSWGIVTFQLFTGVHPYKGVLDGYARGDMKKRMQDNASIFHPNVKLSHAVRDPSLIPKGLLAWYKAVFEHGERGAPPTDFTNGRGSVQVVHFKQVHVTGVGKLVYTKLFETGNEKVLTIFPSGIVLLTNGALADLHLKRVVGTIVADDIQLVETEDGYIACGKQQESSVCMFINKKNFICEEVLLPCEVAKFVRFENRLFGVAPTGLVEFTFHKFAKVVASVKATWNALPDVTEWLSGFGLQNTLGATYLIFPYDDGACAYVRVKELDGLTIMCGVRGKRSFSVGVLTKKGESKRYDYFLSVDCKTYTYKVTDIDTFDFSEVTLPKGLRIAIVEDGKLEAVTPRGDKVVTIEDKDIVTSGQLYHKGDTVLYVRDSIVWSISMK